MEVEEETLGVEVEVVRLRKRVLRLRRRFWRSKRRQSSLKEILRVEEIVKVDEVIISNSIDLHDRASRKNKKKLYGPKTYVSNEETWI